MSRRAYGALETDVLGVLWDDDSSLTPGEVRDALGGDLAYTTVMTVLTRLFEKGLVTRTQQGPGVRVRAGPVAVGVGGATDARDPRRRR